MTFTRQTRHLSYYWKLRNWYAGLVKPGQRNPPYIHVVQVGDPRLRSRAEDIIPDNIKRPEVQELIKHMSYVFNKYNCVGLSAPQIGVNSKLFVMEFQEKHAKEYSEKEFKLKEMSLMPFTVYMQ